VDALDQGFIIPLSASVQEAENLDLLAWRFGRAAAAPNTSLRKLDAGGRNTLLRKFE
jgi:hypothetical protein